MSEKHPEAPRIMIVDDAPQNIELLEFMLLAQGYQVFALPNGEMALKAAAKTRPAMILLDILMPGLDGYEVCRRLKADPHLQDIPVLFLSALNEPLDKARAFQVGGVDYITKPFQLVEIEARVRTHLQLHRQSRELQTNYERLRELEQLRDGLVHMMVHDMRSPLAALTIAAEAMGDALSKTDPYLVEMVTVARQSTQTLCRMASNLLDISRLESSQMPLHPTQENLAALAQAVRESSSILSEGRRIVVDAPEPVSTACDAQLIGRVLGNLVGNALKFIPKDGEIRLSVRREAPHAHVAVSDNGAGIAPEFHRKIFDKFSQVEVGQGRRGVGLGLAFCKLAVEAHGGQIGVISEVGRGSTFWFTLPLVPAASRPA